MELSQRFTRTIRLLGLTGIAAGFGCGGANVKTDWVTIACGLPGLPGQPDIVITIRYNDASEQGSLVVEAMPREGALTHPTVRVTSPKGEAVCTGGPAGDRIEVHAVGPLPQMQFYLAPSGQVQIQVRSEDGVELVTGSFTDPKTILAWSPQR